MKCHSPPAGIAESIATTNIMLITLIYVIINSCYSCAGFTPRPRPPRAWRIIAMTWSPATAARATKGRLPSGGAGQLVRPGERRVQWGDAPAELGCSDPTHTAACGSGRGPAVPRKTWGSGAARPKGFRPRPTRSPRNTSWMTPCNPCSGRSRPAPAGCSSPTPPTSAGAGSWRAGSASSGGSSRPGPGGSGTASSGRSAP